MLEAKFDFWLQQLQLVTKPMVKRDRDQYNAGLVEEATRAAERGDSKAMWTLVKRLSGETPKALKTVRSDDGLTVLVHDSDVKKRWTEHFAGLLKADLVSDLDSLMPYPEAVHATSKYSPSAEDVNKQLSCGKRGKAPGPDGIHNELLRAGGFVLAEHIAVLLRHIAAVGAAPIDFRGGRLREVWKRKGDPQICANSRGLIISHELSKIFTGTLQAELTPTYNKFLPETQCGAVAGRGTDFANHLVRSVIDFAYLRNYCYFLLFLDLEKAFDYVVREYLWGWSQDFKADPVKHLVGLGLDHQEALRLSQEIKDTGSLLLQVGVDPLVVDWSGHCTLTAGQDMKTWKSYSAPREEDDKAASSDPWSSISSMR